VAKAIPLFMYGAALPGIGAESRVIVTKESVNVSRSLVRPDTSPVERFIAPLH